jgi:6-phosphogluconolactonase
VAAIDDAPKAPQRRLTLTLPALAGAYRVAVAALGDTKADAVRESLRDPQSPLPLALLIRRAPRVTVLLDAAAAGRL